MIYFLGDVHGRFDHVIRAVLRDRPDGIVFLGDIEAQQPLDLELEPILKCTDIWWIPGNHDTDHQRNYDHLYGSTLANKNLHGRVGEIAGQRVAGLGGIFRGEIWYPDSPDAPVNYERYDDYLENSEPGRIQASLQHRALRQGEMTEVKATGKLLTHRSSIYFADWLELQGQQTDILVTHEAPSCHHNGFKALDELARAMKVKKVFHGHHHDRRDYRPVWERLGFEAYGVGLRGITDQDGNVVRAGELDHERL